MEASLGELEVGADLLGATFPERGGGFRFADALRGGFGGSEGVATCFVELTLALSEDDVVVDEGLGGIVEVGPTLDGELDGVLGAALRVLRVVELGVRQGGAGAVVVEETGGDDAGRAEGGTGEETASGAGGRGGAGRARRARGRRSAPKQARSRRRSCRRERLYPFRGERRAWNFKMRAPGVGGRAQTGGRRAAAECPGDGAAGRESRRGGSDCGSVDGVGA